MTIDSPIIAGVDEAGRGPLAGPVVAASVILKSPLDGLTDSKKLSEKKREALFSIICRDHIYAYAIATPKEIDALNILQASLLAMKRSIMALPVRPTRIRVDGNQIPMAHDAIEAIVKGDALHPEISAASIVAKVIRDRLMLQLASRYPQWDFASHKGYPTAKHMGLLSEHGVSPIHRLSFAPVARCLSAEGV